MSRTQVVKIQNKIVLARSFGDEPLVLPAKSEVGGLVELDLGDATVLFLESDVFAFDADLYGRLKSAFEAGDSPVLEALWNEVGRRIAPPAHPANVCSTRILRDHRAAVNRSDRAPR